MPSVWDNAISTVQERIKPHSYALWFEPIVCTGIDGDHIALTAPNEFVRDWFRDNYLPVVLDVIQRQTQQRFRATIHIDEQAANDALPPAEDEPAPGDRAPAASAPELIPVEPPAGQSVELLPRFTFDSFVVGPANQLAHAAARAVAEHPAERYNPLFIYGGVGLGKTHLLMSIGHELRRRNPCWKIAYISAERFINEYISAIRPSESRSDNRMDEFRHRYRVECDALLIDDIQFLANKERTQDEFFHTFNALYEAHKQIVLTSDKFPREINNLEERLQTRFAWGLVADIQSPDLETRSAILRRKAEAEGLVLPTDVALYLAEHIKSNVRELEGSLVRLSAYASLTGARITLELVRDALGNVLGADQSDLTMDRILREVANYFHQKVGDLRGPRRHHSVAWPRQVAMYLCYRLLQRTSHRASYPAVADFFGGRDHTTVLAACRKVEKLRTVDRAVRDVIDTLERRLLT